MQPQTYRTIAWTLYIVGFVLVAGSWIRLVPVNIGWAGWLVGMIGWGMFRAGRPKPRTAEQKLRDLDDFRQKGLITEEEYAKQRDRILTG